MTWILLRSNMLGLLSVCLAAFAASPAARAEPDPGLEYTNQPALAAVNFLSAYNQGYSGSGVKIGIVDSGINPNHVEFNNALVAGMGWYRSDPSDLLASNWLSREGISTLNDLQADGTADGHGSFVTSIAAARLDNSGRTGNIMGVAYNAKLVMGTYIFTQRNTSDVVIAKGLNDEQAAQTIDFVSAQGVKVINNSWGSSSAWTESLVDGANSSISKSPLEVAALKRAQDRGAVIVFAAGNDSIAWPGAPATVPSVDNSVKEKGGWIVVAATTIRGIDPATDKIEMAQTRPDLNSPTQPTDSYTNYCGDTKLYCISAPGGFTETAGPTDRRGINGALSTNNSQYADPGQGTSYATPLVTGAVALVAEKYPWMTSKNLGVTLLTTGTTAANPSAIWGRGLLDIGKAINGPGIFEETFAANVASGVSSTFSNNISGSAGLEKLGDGSLSLTGANSYTGDTTVQKGTLRVNGILASQVVVNLDGTLRGTGEISKPVDVSGTLAPGNSPGTLTVNGTVTQHAGSTLQIDIDGTGTGNGAGNYSRLIVNGGGSRFYADGTLDPILRGITGNANNTFTPAIGDQFRIVTAQGGIQGRFSTVNRPALGLADGTQLDLFYDGGGSNSIDQFATPSSYANHVALWGGNSNARAVGQALDFMRGLDGTNLATDRQNELRYELAGLRSAQIASFATALSGEVHGAMAAAAPQAGRWLQTSLARRLAASAGSVEPAGLKVGDNGWLDFSASQGRSDGGSAASGYSDSRYQFAIGADILHSRANRLGVGVTYANANVGAASGSGTVEEVAPLVYGQYAVSKRQKVIIDGLFAYGFSTWQTQRADPLRSASELKTNAGGNSVALGFGARSPFAFGPVGIEPFVRVLWQNASRSAVSEGLASPAALELPSYSLSGSRLSVGTAVGSKVSDPLAAPFTYRAGIAFGEDFGNFAFPTVQASLAGTNFQISSPKIGREFAQLSLSTTYKVIDGAYVYAGLNGEARENRLDGGVNTGFNLKF